MTTTLADARFGGSIAEFYERHLVPLIFEPYASDLARRIAAISPRDVLEIAAGTGVVTRALAAALPPATRIVATDLNPPMLAEARRVGTARPVEWQPADAMQLPFGDGSFDVVACQFGAMFFPARVQAFAEARRVLRDRGSFISSVWDRIERNELADVVTQALAALFPADPPRFMARTPHGHFDVDVLTCDLATAGFGAAPRVDAVAARSRAASAEAAALAYCQGTPLRDEIEARAPGELTRVTDACAAAIAARFGAGPIDAAIQAIVVTIAC